MSTAYAVNTGSTSMRSGKRAVTGSGVTTWTRTRAYMKFDVSPGGYTLSQIDSVLLWTYSKSVFSGGSGSDYDLHTGSAGDNWGSTLEATEADFLSTAVNLEDTNFVDATGWFSWVVDKNNLDLSGYTYFKIRTQIENDGGYEFVDWASQNSTTNKPYLEITLVSGRRIFVVS